MIEFPFIFTFHIQFANLDNKSKERNILESIVVLRWIVVLILVNETYHVIQTHNDVDVPINNSHDSNKNHTKMKSLWLWNVTTRRPSNWGSSTQIENQQLNIRENNEPNILPTRRPNRVVKLFKISSGWWLVTAPTP